jgi:TRAP-type C4-dicarboxylate transport system permease small subunit
MKDTTERWLGTLFGLIFVGLSLVVTVETIVRKVFNVSLQGADELGGYSLAFGATIAFSLAVMGRSHIRVDVFHDHLPLWLQRVLNWLSIVSIAAFAILLAVLAWFVLEDSRSYQSVSQTPWATPLSWPQGAWMLGLLMFAMVSTAFALRATWLLVTGRSKALSHEFGPRSTKEEVEEELEDLKNRSTGHLVPTTATATSGTGAHA